MHPGSWLAAYGIYGSIASNVADPSSAPITKARVTIHDPETAESRKGLAIESGRYDFPDVATGTHDFTSIREDFATVSINHVSREEPAMRVGAVSESVRVWAQAGALQAETSEVGAKSLSILWRTHPYSQNTTIGGCFYSFPGVSPPDSAHSIPSNPSGAFLSGVNGASNTPTQSLAPRTGPLKSDVVKAAPAAAALG